MNKRTPILLAIIILLPVALLAWYGVRDQHNQQALLQHQLSNLIDSRLQQVDRRLQDHFFALQDRLIPDARQLQSSTAGRYSPAALRDYIKRSPLLQQLFVLTADGTRLFPPLNQPLNREEQAFIGSTETLLQSPELFVQREAEQIPSASAGATLAADAARDVAQISRQSSAKDSTQSVAKSEPGSYSPSAAGEQLFSASLRQAAPELQLAPVLEDAAATDNPHGWIAWYADTGLQHIFWWQDGEGTTLGFVLNRARLLSDLINTLPDSDAADQQLGQAEIRLIDNRGDTSFAWGNYRSTDAEAARRVRPLSHPLGSWRVAWYAPELQVSGDGWLGFGALLALLTAGLSTLGYLLYREHNRELQLAEQRVNFVNQVSHELKTPLTNVRLYAEMLEQQLPPEEEDPLPQRYLQVIASESQRLSRLIENVLSFSRLKRGSVKISLQMGIIDERIEQIIHNFAPALADRNLRVRFDSDADQPRLFDAEALEQILNNLISNCEKYAADGGYIDIGSRLQGAHCQIRVRDYGPGIQAQLAERIFTPFYRISHRLTDGITGTGIGLGLARELARAHQGDLRLDTTDNQGPGACFVLTLNAPEQEAHR